MIINLQDDKEWEQQRAVIEPAFNQFMQFKMAVPTMEECWETAPISRVQHWFLDQK